MLLRRRCSPVLGELVPAGPLAVQLPAGRRSCRGEAARLKRSGILWVSATALISVQRIKSLTSLSGEELGSSTGGSRVLQRPIWECSGKPWRGWVCRCPLASELNHLRPPSPTRLPARGCSAWSGRTLFVCLGAFAGARRVSCASLALHSSSRPFLSCPHVSWKKH